MLFTTWHHGHHSTDVLQGSNLILLLNRDNNQILLYYIDIYSINYSIILVFHREKDDVM